jgi:hypothetical protein
MAGLIILFATLADMSRYPPALYQIVYERYLADIIFSITATSV